MNNTQNSHMERKTLFVVILTTITMVVEIAAGFITNSMALLADGWHMGTHAFALGITFCAYFFIRKHANSGQFVFGTGKFGVLSGYTSSLLLGLTAVWIIFESLTRFIHPLKIEFNEAILIAVIGLMVNLLSIFIMKDHGHSDGHCDSHSHKEDHNYMAAYFHILADVLTSVFAISALLAGRFFGWTILDPIIGLVGGVVILYWAYGLITGTGRILLDMENGELKKQIGDQLKNMGCNSYNLKVWKNGSNESSAIIELTAETECSLGQIKDSLASFEDLSYLNISRNVF